MSLHTRKRGCGWGVACGVGVYMSGRTPIVRLCGAGGTRCPLFGLSIYRPAVRVRVRAW